MEPKIQYGPVTYTGYDHKNNGKFIVERGKGTYTYVSYQNDEFTKTICGYVVKQNDDTYKAFQLGTFETDFKDRNVKFFDSLEDVKAYSVHPAHVAAAGIIKDAKEDRACVDFEI